MGRNASGLNPYYTGSYSMRVFDQTEIMVMRRLNPYYTGSYSMSSGTTLVSW